MGSPFHPSIQDAFARQASLFQRWLQMSFAAAGIFWIVLYIAQYTTSMEQTAYANARAAQTPIYFILLTLWGIFYLRTAAALRCVAQISNERSTVFSAVQLAQIPPEQLHMFGTMVRATPTRRGYIMPSVNVVLLVASNVLIILQYCRVFL
jgi:hypothetical protein